MTNLFASVNFLLLFLAPSYLPLAPICFLFLLTSLLLTSPLLTSSLALAGLTLSLSLFLPLCVSFTTIFRLWTKVMG